MKRSPMSWIAMSALVAASAAAAAGDPAIDAAKSRITVTFKQENVPVDASFKRFNGRIDYDPSKPNASKAAIEVETGSFDMGSAEYNAEVKKKSWLDSSTYPKASFISTSVKPDAGGHFDATGTLTLKGKSQAMTVPVSTSHSGTAATFDGVLEISRAYFGVGDPEWKDVVDDKISIRFHLVERGAGSN